MEVIKAHPSENSSAGNSARCGFVLGERYFKVDSAYSLYGIGR